MYNHEIEMCLTYAFCDIVREDVEIMVFKLNLNPKDQAH